MVDDLCSQIKKLESENFKLGKQNDKFTSEKKDQDLSVDNYKIEIKELKKEDKKMRSQIGHLRSINEELS